MSVVTAILVVFLLIYVLSVLRNQLLFELQSVSLLLFNSASPGLALYAILFLPGTIIHELSHWIVAEILQIPTGEISILPEYNYSDRTERRLGSVMTARTDPIRGFLIGSAPLIVGLIVLTILGSIVSSLPIEEIYLTERWKIYVLMYSFIVMGNSIATSKSDRRYLPFMVVFSLLIYFVLAWSGVKLGDNTSQLIISITKNINYALFITIELSLAVIIIGSSVRKILEKITKRRIIKK